MLVFAIFECQVNIIIQEMEVGVAYVMVVN